MQRMIELPGRRARPNRLILFLIFAVVVILLGKSTALSYYVDSLWFGSLGYGEVFWKSLGLEWSVFAVFFAATFLILYGWFLALWQMHQPDLPHDRAIFIGRQRLSLPLRRSLRVLGIVVSLGVSVLGGAVMMADWPTFTLFWKAPRAAGASLDPVFGKAAQLLPFRPSCMATHSQLADGARRRCLHRGRGLPFHLWRQQGPRQESAA